MQKTIVSTLFAVLALSASTSTVAAQTQTQTQEVSQSSTQKVAFECQGNPCVVNLENTANQTAKQTQNQSDVAVEAVRPVRRAKARATKRAMHTKWVAPAPQAVASDGKVRLNWSMRSGTCHVRYGESSTKSYPYETSTGCDNGSITIGGLVPGRAYRFQVSIDRQSWTKPVTVVAK